MIIAQFPIFYQPLLQASELHILLHQSWTTYPYTILYTVIPYPACLLLISTAYHLNKARGSVAVKALRY